MLPFLTTDLCSWGRRRKLWWAANLINNGEWGGWLLCVCVTAWYVHTCVSNTCPWHYGLALNASSSRYTYIMYTRGSWYPKVYILYVCVCSSKNCLHGRVIMCVVGWVVGTESSYLCAVRMWCILAPSTDWKYAFCVWVYIGRLSKPRGGWHTFSSACPPLPMPVIYIPACMCSYMCTCESIQ